VPDRRNSKYKQTGVALQCVTFGLCNFSYRIKCVLLLQTAGRHDAFIIRMFTRNDFSLYSRSSELISVW
jgi:hypothetical protein